MFEAFYKNNINACIYKFIKHLPTGNERYRPLYELEETKNLTKQGEDEELETLKEKTFSKISRHGLRL